MKITKKSHPELVKLARLAFPEYTGRKFQVKYESTVDVSYNANWSGGSRTEYKFIRLDNGAVFTPPDFSPWDRPKNEIAKLPKGAACIKHIIFCGHDLGLHIALPFEYTPLPLDNK